VLAVREHMQTFKSVNQPSRWGTRLQKGMTNENYIVTYIYLTTKGRSSREIAREMLRKIYILRHFVHAKCSCYWTPTSKKQLDTEDAYDTVARTWFSGEKVFTVQAPTDTQNDCVLSSLMLHENGYSRAGSTSLRVSRCQWRCPNMARRQWCLLIRR